MPDEKGLLSQEEIQTVTKKFTELEKARGSDIVCEVCSNTQWMSGSSLIGLKSDIKNPLLAHTRLPSIAFVCSNCGNVKLFAAGFMGIAPFVASEEEGDEDGS